MVCDGFIFNREDHTKKDLYIELIDFDSYNLFTSAMITGEAAPGVSSGEALAAVEEIASEVLPRGYDTEWSGAVSYTHLLRSGRCFPRCVAELRRSRSFRSDGKSPWRRGYGGGLLFLLSHNQSGYPLPGR